MPLGSHAGEPVAISSPLFEPLETTPLPAEVPEEPAQHRNSEAFSAVSGAVAIDEPPKAQHEKTGYEMAGKPVSTIAVIVCFVVLAALLLVGAQHNRFDSWQDRLSIWWSDFSTASPPQDNGVSIPRIPEEREVWLPEDSVLEPVVPVAEPDNEILSVDLESSHIKSEQPMMPQVEPLSIPVKLPATVGQVEEVQEGVGAMLDDADEEGLAQVRDIAITDEDLPQPGGSKAEQAAEAEVAPDAAALEVAPIKETAFQLEFDFDSAELSSGSEAVVKQALQLLTNTEGSIALIVGYSDSLGEDQYNMSLSRRRAEAVASYLADQGIDRSRLRVEGRGAIQMSASIGAAGLLSGYNEWRIVEIRISAPEKL